MSQNADKRVFFFCVHPIPAHNPTCTTRSSYQIFKVPVLLMHGVFFILFLQYLYLLYDILSVSLYNVFSIIILHLHRICIFSLKHVGLVIMSWQRVDLQNVYCKLWSKCKILIIRSVWTEYSMPLSVGLGRNRILVLF